MKRNWWKHFTRDEKEYICDCLRSSPELGITNPHIALLPFVDSYKIRLALLWGRSGPFSFEEDRPYQYIRDKFLREFK